MKPLKVSLDQWRALQAVVDYGGYAQAAAQMHRSQSSVSHAVSKLQAQLGVPLLRIEGRRAVLTTAGEVVHPGRSTAVGRVDHFSPKTSLFPQT